MIEKCCAVDQHPLRGRYGNELLLEYGQNNQFDGKGRDYGHSSSRSGVPNSQYPGSDINFQDPTSFNREKVPVDQHSHIYGRGSDSDVDTFGYSSNYAHNRHYDHERGFSDGYGYHKNEKPVDPHDYPHSYEHESDSAAFGYSSNYAHKRHYEHERGFADGYENRENEGEYFSDDECSCGHSDEDSSFTYEQGDGWERDRFHGRGNFLKQHKKLHGHKHRSGQDHSKEQGHWHNRRSKAGYERREGSLKGKSNVHAHWQRSGQYCVAFCAKTQR